MKISIQKLPKSEIELLIEVPAKQFEQFIEKAILDLGKDLKVEGFRPGKAPPEIIKKTISQEKILKVAAEKAIKKNYLEAVSQLAEDPPVGENIEVLGQPQIEILKLAPGNPLVFRARTSILPKIKLPDYKKIASKIKRKKIWVEEKEIEQTLSWLQKSRAKFTLKSGSAQKGDWVEIEYWSPQIAKGRKIKDRFILGEGHFIEGFEEKLIGMKAGEEKEEFSLTLPKDYFPKELAGKKISFKVKLNLVQKVELPEINDQWASSLGQFENLKALKESIREGIYQEKEIKESHRLRNEILEKINQSLGKVVLPQILVEREKNQILQDFKNRITQDLKISFEDYLNQIKKSEQELLDSFSDQAEKRIKISLILREIAKCENIQVSDEEVIEEINKILKNYPGIEQAQKEIDLPKLKEYTREIIRNEKILAKLESLAQKT